MPPTTTATGDGVKVGGHQASSASLVTVMTALYVAHLDAPDKISVKPHASPTFHAIQYLLGNLDRSYLPTLRAFGGLQSYPSRTKIRHRRFLHRLGGARRRGAAVRGGHPSLRGRALRRQARQPVRRADRRRRAGRGQHLGGVLRPGRPRRWATRWIIEDVNRQSLDRVVPGIRIAQWKQQVTGAGWHVVEAKYGHRLQAAFPRSGGRRSGRRSIEIANEHYQSLFGVPASSVRQRFLDGAPDEVRDFCAGIAMGMIGPQDAVLWRLGWEPLCTAERGCKNRPCELERFLSASAPLAALGHSAVSRRQCRS